MPQGEELRVIERPCEVEYSEEGHSKEGLHLFSCASAGALHLMIREIEMYRLLHSFGSQNCYGSEHNPGLLCSSTP